MCPGDVKSFFDSCVLDVGSKNAYEVLYYLGMFLLLLGLTCRMRILVPLFLLLLVLEFLTPCYLVWFLIMGVCGSLFGVGIARYPSVFQHTSFTSLYSLAPIALCLELVMTAHCRVERHSFQGMAITLIQTATWFATFLFVTGLRSQHVLVKTARLLGRYTLFAYMLQMPIARLTHMAFTHIGLVGLAYCLCAIAVVTICTVTAVAFLDYLRRTLLRVDRIYRVIFA